MLSPLSPQNEAARLAALRALKILDTPPEQRFDRITAFAKNLFQVPIALVSLVDKERQWFKSRAGLEATETPRSVSFCGHAILAQEVFVIEDATIDERFRDNPLVTGPPFVRFYAGAPLNSGTLALGTLCLIGHEPRHFDGRDRGLLIGLAGWVERELTILSDLQTMAIRLESQTRLEAVLDGIAEGVITKIPGGEIQTVNRAACEMFRCEPEALIGKNIRDLVPERDRAAQDKYAHYLEQLPDPLVRAGIEATALRSDGSEFSVELSFSRINLEGRRVYSGILRDISERKRIEQMKNEFVSTVSHELRTPLTSIRGALGLVIDGFAGEVPEQAREMINIAHNNSERLVRLINDILDMEKIEAGMMTLERQLVELRRLLERAVADNAGYASEHQVRFEIRGHVPELQVFVDHDRMLQVLTNLLSNAAKFSPAGETVAVSAALVDGRVRISVEDRGPGISEDFQQRIFGKFAQADSSDTRQKGGTGLGLSITKAIVESHGGTIGFNTGADKGTVFYVDLPVRSAPRTVAAPAGDDAGSARILICEDDKDIAHLLSLMLSQGGYRPEVAYTAKQAKEMLSQKSFAAMTLDLALPDQDGISLLRELRSQPATRGLPIIVISAKAAQGRQEINGDAVGVIDWLEKPIDPDRLARGLRAAVHAGTGARPRILHVEDDVDILSVVAALVGDSARLVSARTLKDAVRLLTAETFDLVILDLGLPDGPGENVLPLLQRGPGKGMPVIIFSAQEVSRDMVASIEAVLVKSKTTNEELLRTIKSYVARVGATVASSDG